jgi:N-acetylmuramoyl-L-alanine amidase
MSKYLYILDYGHGGLINKVYTTPGKRSPKFDDGSILYEGVNNRDNVQRLIRKFKALGIDYIDIVNSNNDIPLSKRVSDANKLLSKGKKCIYISIHSDANGDGIKWDLASGISVYTSKGQTKSDVFASLVIDQLEGQFETSVKWRKDNSDGDEDKEENFYVLANTIMPAILIEAGFHTNKEEAKRMLTDEWKDKLINSIVLAVLQWEKLY